MLGPVLSNSPLDSWGCNATSAIGGACPPAGAGDIVMVDAGSSGSKVFAFSGNKTATAKLLTQCTEAKRAEGMTNMGLASLAYSKESCNWQIGEKDLAPLAQAADYANSLLKLLRDTYTSSSGKKNVDEVKNRGSVPVLATAGMRLLSQSANGKVWSNVCGKSGAGFTIAPAGPQCGTIPGTTEAFYEFVSNAAYGRGSRVLTGTFTIGGASAQIAIPLMKPQDVEDFEALKASIAE